VDYQDRPAFNRAKALIAALNEAGRPLVVNGLLQAVLIAEANAKDADRGKENAPSGVR
jgi:hypothetical protein